MTNTKATKQAGRAANAQAGIANQYAGQLHQLFGQAQPYYGGSLQGLAQNAGIGPNGQVSPNVFNLPAQELQFRQAAEDAGRGFQNAANQLKYQFNQQGVGGSALGAALAALSRGQEQDLGNFRRNLAIQAPEIQNQRIGQLLNAGQLGLAGNPMTAVAGLGQASSNLFNQGSLSNSLLGQALNAYGTYTGLNAMGHGGGTGGFGVSTPYGGFGGGGYNPYVPDAALTNPAGFLGTIF